MKPPAYQLAQLKKQAENSLLASAVLVFALLPWVTLAATAQNAANEFPSTAPQSNTSLVQQIGEQGMAVPKTPIYNEDSLFYNQATPNQSVPLNSAGGFNGDWSDQWTMANQAYQIGGIGAVFGSNVAQLIISVFQWTSQQIAPYLAKGLIWILNQAIYNPNIAAGEPVQIAKYIQPIANIMRAIAFDLLLLLFILAIWKYWTQAAWKSGGNLTGAVGRLIVTALLLIGWNTISDYIIQISNDLISQILFGQQDAALIKSAMTQLVNMGLEAFATSILGQILGGISFFALLLVLLYQGLYLMVLKATQMTLLIAQYMFAPIFLVFFASPSTENVATGFVKSFVEVSLWTFVWIGMLRIMIIVLGSGWNPFGQMILVIGTLQLMVNVPQFIAKAQISPASELFEGGFILFQAHRLAKATGFVGGGGPGGLVKQGLTALSNKLNNPSITNSVNSRAATQLASFGGGPGAGPGGGAGGGPGGAPPPTPTFGPPSSPSAGPTATGGAAPAANPFNTTPGVTPATTAGNPAFPGAPNTNLRTGTARNKKQLQALSRAGASWAEATTGGKAPGKGGMAEPSPAGNEITPLFTDGNLSGMSIGRDVSPEARNRARTIGGMANQLLSDPSARSALETDAKALGYKPPAPGDRDGQSKWNKGLGLAAVNGAAGWMKGQSTSAIGKHLRSDLGEMTPENEATALQALADPSLPHSPYNGDYQQNKKTVTAARLEPTAGPMAAAQMLKAAGARTTPGSFAGAYRALGAAARPSLPAGLQSGTVAHDAALGTAIRGLGQNIVKSAAAVGAGLTGMPGAGLYTDEDVEHLVEATDNMVSGGGARDHVAAFGALSSIARATNGFTAGNRGSLNANLAHATLVANSLGQRNCQSLQNPNFASQVFQLDDGPAHNQVNPVSMARAANIASRVGPGTFQAPRDLDDVEWMVQHGGYSEATAAGDLRYNQAAALAAGGTLLTRSAIQTLQGIGRGPTNAHAVAAATVLATNGWNGSRASSGAQQIIQVAVDEMGAGRNVIDGHTAASVPDYIRHMPASILGGYMDIANHPDGVQYVLEEVRQAADLSTQGHFKSASAGASFIHRTVAASAPPGGAPTFNAAQISHAYQQMGSSGFSRSAMTTPVTLTMVDHFENGLLDPGSAQYPAQMAAAATLAQNRPDGDFDIADINAVMHMQNNGFSNSCINNRPVMNTMAHLIGTRLVDPADRGQMAAAARVAEIIPSGNFTDGDISMANHMSTLCGWNLNQITPVNLAAADVLYHDHHIEPQRQLVSNLTNAGIDLDPANAAMVYVASQPEMQRVPVQELRGASENAIRYVEACTIVGTPGLPTTVQDLSPDILRACTADNRFSGTMPPSATVFVTPNGPQQYIDDINYLAGHIEQRTTIDGLPIST